MSCCLGARPAPITKEQLTRGTVIGCVATLPGVESSSGRRASSHRAHVIQSRLSAVTLYPAEDPLGRYLSTDMPLASKGNRVFWASGATIAAIGAFVICCPFGSDRLETAVDVVALASIPVFCGIGLPAYCIAHAARGDYRPRRSDVVVMGLFVLFCAVLLFPYIGRNQQAELLRLQFDGKVIRKYHSDNHQIESIRVRSEDEAVVVMEGVEYATWVALQGDDHLTKSAWSPYARLNGKPVRLVPRGLLDSIRGLE
jgi:hypothetical protein